MGQGSSTSLAALRGQGDNQHNDDNEQEQQRRRQGQGEEEGDDLLMGQLFDNEAVVRRLIETGGYTHLPTHLPSSNYGAPPSAKQASAVATDYFLDLPDSDEARHNNTAWVRWRETRSQCGVCTNAGIRNWDQRMVA